MIDWRSELDRVAYKYHYLIALIAVILNPLWSIADYLTIPNHFWDFLYFRLIITFFIVLTLFFSKKFLKNPWVIAFVPFLGISIQNAYMYSVMDIAEFQKHTFAYITLFIGAGMFVLWKTYITVIIVVLSFIANIVTFSIFGKLSLNEVLINGGLLTFSVAVFSIFLIQTRTRLNKNEIFARFSLIQSKKQLEEKNELIERHHEEMISSIHYASRIQNAFLPTPEKLRLIFEDYFILYKAKDIVSGDFYWVYEVNTTPDDPDAGERLVVVGVADCTGHGVPGALMSIIGNTILNQSLKVKDVNSPADALEFLNRELGKNLKTIKDGMDISLCAYNKETLKLQFSGANNPVYIVRQGELIELKPDKMGIGSDIDNLVKKFENKDFQLQKGDVLYLFSDGYADQFGGPESYRGGKKIKYNRFKELLTTNSTLTMTEQKEALEHFLDHWQGDLEQVDDILVVGIRI